MTNLTKSIITSNLYLRNFSVSVQTFFSRSALGTSLGNEWRYMRIVFAAIALWFIGAKILFLFTDVQSLTSPDKAKIFALKIIVRTVLFMLILLMVRLYQFHKFHSDKSPLKEIYLVFTQRPHIIGRFFVMSLLSVISFTILMTTFMSVKITIPEFVPFYFDKTARKLDRILFFGRDPWELMSSLYQYTKVISVIDFCYTAWAGLIAGTWMYCFTTSTMDRHRRYQFCLALILLWVIGGNFLAMAFSTAGPVYYGYFTGDEAAYAGLMVELHRINEISPLGAVEYHSFLLDMYKDKMHRSGGISAMPSLHCGTTLLLLITFCKTPIPRLLMSLFTVIIFVGSVLLAWHYAIDGLLAIPLTIGCWKLAGLILQKYASPAQLSG